MLLLSMLKLFTYFIYLLNYLLTGWLTRHTCLFIYLFIYLFTYLFIYLFIYLIDLFSDSWITGYVHETEIQGTMKLHFSI